MQSSNKCFGKFTQHSVNPTPRNSHSPTPRTPHLPPFSPDLIQPDLTLLQLAVLRSACPTLYHLSPPCPINLTPPCPPTLHGPDSHRTPPPRPAPRPAPPRPPHLPGAVGVRDGERHRGEVRVELGDGRVDVDGRLSVSVGRRVEDGPRFRPCNSDVQRVSRRRRRNVDATSTSMLPLGVTMTLETR